MSWPKPLGGCFPQTARLLVELADERHPVDHHGVGGAGAQRCEIDDVIGERQAVLHV